MATGYATAWFGLQDLARIGRGERVLIYPATGGVGLAAIAIARAAGAEIFATAGSILTSRSGPNAQAERTIARLKANGADIVVECGNIA